MTIDAGLKPEGAPARSPIAGAGAPSGVDAGPKRYSVQRKLAVVARLLRGEPLDVVAREANVSVAKLTEWRERALAGAASALKERERDDREDEIARLKSKVGEITMDNELLSAKIAAMEAKSPLARRRTATHRSFTSSHGHWHDMVLNGNWFDVTSALAVAEELSTLRVSARYGTASRARSQGT